MARVGWSVPLGGPFRVSGNLGCFGGLVQLFAVLIVLAFPVLLILALFALVYTYWVQIVIVVGSIIALVFVIKKAASWKDGLKPQPPEVILPKRDQEATRTPGSTRTDFRRTTGWPSPHRRTSRTSHGSRLAPTPRNRTHTMTALSPNKGGGHHVL